MNWLNSTAARPFIFISVCGLAACNPIEKTSPSDSGSSEAVEASFEASDDSASTFLSAEAGPVPCASDAGTADKSQAAAVAVVTCYYSALNAHDYQTAWLQWGENGPGNQTLARFTSGFAHTQSTHVTIGKLEPAEGAAGSIYQTVPVVVEATLDNGTHQRFTGEYVVRRVNGVDGATPAQLRWHIGSAHLAAAPAG